MRNAILFGGNLISNAFSALVGAGVLSNMQGSLGHAAWRWLFWIEGAATMFVAILAVFILPDLPTNTRGFSPVEAELAQLRMQEDVGEADTDNENQGVFDGLIMAVKDFKIYLMMLTLTAYVVGLSFNAFFVSRPPRPPSGLSPVFPADPQPSLTQTLGFGYVPTLLMSAPPWVFSVIVSMINAWHADKTSEKFWHIVGPILMGVVGFVISMATEQVAARYVALFLQAGSYAGFIVFYSWISSTFIRPPAKRAVALAMINAFSQLGNIAGSYVWKMKENGYRKSYGIVLAMFGVAIFGCFLFRMILVAENKKLDQIEAEAGEAQVDKRDATHVENPNVPKRGFRYLV